VGKMAIITKEGQRTFIDVGSKLVFDPITKCLKILKYESGIWQEIYWHKNNDGRQKFLMFLNDFSMFTNFAKLLAFTLGLDINKPHTQNNKWVCTLRRKYDYKYFVVRPDGGFIYDGKKKLAKIISNNDDACDFMDIQLYGKGVVPVCFIQNSNAFFAFVEIICETHWLKTKKRIESKDFFAVTFETL